ncbi:gamma-glutamylcyclotransferase [Candidatus Parcubacteria bacterium]|jgi:gamma-glutamylcyclotransferase (GGCT)/AIG2-like uncharacterized protein YtfP|nr:MAG: gamma-glutamylcyclotransferase [Candidatus Parcubacteria bacterium]
MDHLFAYGTLADPEVLKKIIGRAVAPTPDKLHGYQYKDTMVVVDGEFYPGIEECEELSVDGVVYDIYQEELSLIDQYEGGIYKRKRVRLESNIDAFVYIPDHID